MTATFVDHFRFTLGSRCYSVEESVSAGRTWSPAGAFLASGFKYHHVCGPNESAFDLALETSAAIGADLGHVDAIVYANCLPLSANLAPSERFEGSRDVKDLMDFPVSRLQSAMGLDAAFAVGLGQQACTSMLGSIRLAHGLIAGDEDLNRVLCISADRFPPGAYYEQAYSLISDGAAACVVSRQPATYRLLAAHQITNGAMVDADDDQTVGAFFAYTCRLVTELLAKAAISTRDITWVVPQNTDSKAWRIVARLLGIDSARVWAPGLAEVGHVISADNVVNLKALEDHGVEPGARLLLTMAGYGMNWQGLILERC